MYFSVPDPIMHRNESYSTHQLNNQLHSVATPTTINSTDPYDDIILPERVEVVDHNQQNTNTQVETATPTSMGGETRERRDDTEEHTYETVNKKTSEDGEGEREEPPDYEMAVPGEASWGVMDEGQPHNIN